MKRVSRRYIIIKDHRKYGTFSHLFISCIDYFTTLADGIKCVFNYLSLEEWEALFDKFILTVVEMPKDLSFGFWFTERYNPIFKLRK